ncbi:MAG TPA: twin-arginine translocase subunit TatC [Sulfurihydrogenibium sp.]|jgi:sec-independent protein translocase protein TatC|uniref:twin-arginine translocase subunit TatC n=1 Tax=unclassified Sulfurihydrogenibium TaxID=2619248 RepID=UPI0001750C44|nr:MULTISPECIES: twin-arginine translocase subunit TatC [unclassified Sulfurihydrogenibium]ACD67077.1 Sec-independent protein translocase, TatC subunit [Sulfurihydrogenibium sp. YO3AOP1]HBT98672.1 twin-arginine translocase subunit TatC [Sulfurihydrogenibium sp.]
MDNQLPEAPLTEHLAELRTRLIRIVLAVIIGTVVAFTKANYLFEILKMPLLKVNPNLKLYFLSPTEPFFTAFKISFLAGFILVSPFVFYQIWKFIEPALYEHEKKLVFPFVIFTTLFFIIGCLFSFYLVLPVAIGFFINFGNIQLGAEAIFSVKEYISFVLRMILAFGLTFELPVILSLLARLGLVTPEFLMKSRPYFIVLAFIIAAIITPTPDAISQLMLAIPLILFYEISILMAKYLYPKSMKYKEEIVSVKEKIEA